MRTSLSASLPLQREQSTMDPTLTEWLSTMMKVGGIAVSCCISTVSYVPAKYTADVDEFLLFNNSPQISGRDLRLFYNISGCAQVLCEVRRRTPQIDCEFTSHQLQALSSWYCMCSRCRLSRDWKSDWRMVPRISDICSNTPNSDYNHTAVLSQSNSTHI